MEEVGLIMQRLSEILPKTMPDSFNALQKENDTLTANKIFKEPNLTPVSFIDPAYLKLTEEYHSSLKNICDFQKVLIELNTKVDSSADKSSNISKQIHQIVKDIRLHLAKLDDILLKAENYNSKIKENKFSSYGNFKKSLAQLTETKKHLYKSFSELNHGYIANLHQNDDKYLNQPSYGDIKNSIHAVKYYNYFEKTIEEIIEALNTVYQKLYNDSMNLSDTTKFSLEHLKKRYTMESEFLIHDYVVNSKLDSINKVQHDINKKVDKHKTNDDNLELF
jgi:hypothetical protein